MYDFICSRRPARAVLLFQAEANSSGLSGTCDSKPLRTRCILSAGFVNDVKKSLVIARSGQ